MCCLFLRCRKVVEDDDGEEVTTYKHTCPECSHVICEHWHSFSVDETTHSQACCFSVTSLAFCMLNKKYVHSRTCAPFHSCLPVTGLLDGVHVVRQGRFQPFIRGKSVIEFPGFPQHIPSVCVLQCHQRLAMYALWLLGFLTLCCSCRYVAQERCRSCARRTWKVTWRVRCRMSQSPSRR